MNQDNTEIKKPRIKRIHEYKRQLLNILFVIHRYLELKKKSPGDRQSCQKRVVLIGGKAASAYVNAKIIIKLINNVAKVINNDPDTKQYLKCAFVPNYCVSAAQVMIPASDISEHISTAGTEASGTSNMKLLGSRTPQRCAMATLDAQLNAALVAVGSADGLSAGRREAEEFLLAAQSTWPVSSARFFAQWMADSSKEPTTRQVAALLLKNVLEPVVGARPLSGEWLDYGEEVRKEMHNACWLALLDADPKLRRLAALCTARMGCWEIPQGRWPELLPELQRWAESGSKRHCHASLHTLRCLAEDGASLGVQAQLALLRTCGAQLLSCATEEACWAAEAMFAMLGWLRGADDLLRRWGGNQVVEALLVAHLAADARLAQEDAYAKERALQLHPPLLGEVGHRISNPSGGAHEPNISTAAGCTPQQASGACDSGSGILEQLGTAGPMEGFWVVQYFQRIPTAFAVGEKDLAIGRGDAYAGDGLVEPSQLIPALLALLQSSGESEDSEALEVRSTFGS
eukprot:s794_g10.t1